MKTLLSRNGGRKEDCVTGWFVPEPFFSGRGLLGVCQPQWFDKTGTLGEKMGRIPYFVPREPLIAIVGELGPYDLNEVNLGLHLGDASQGGWL